MTGGNKVACAKTHPGASRHLVAWLRCCNPLWLLTSTAVPEYLGLFSSYLSKAFSLLLITTYPDRIQTVCSNACSADGFHRGRSRRRYQLASYPNSSVGHLFASEIRTSQAHRLCGSICLSKRRRSAHTVCCTHCMLHGASRSFLLGLWVGTKGDLRRGHGLVAESEWQASYQTSNVPTIKPSA